MHGDFALYTLIVSYFLVAQLWKASKMTCKILKQKGILIFYALTIYRTEGQTNVYSLINVGLN